MKLVDEWRLIVRKAWSFKLLALVSVLSGIEVILPYFSEAIPRGIFTSLSFFVTCAALVARIVAQPRMTE